MTPTSARRAAAIEALSLRTGDDAPMPVVPGFTTLRRLGEGAMASVYLARQDGLDRLVALKVLRAELRGDDDLVRRFEEEARILAQLDDEHLVAVFDFVRAGTTPCYVMEYVDGPTLADALREDSLTIGQLREAVIAASEALDVAHRSGVIHRDVKPGNVLLPRGGGAKLGDFGLALHHPSGTRPGGADRGLAIGTPLYMAPEQLDDAERASVESDVYALAATIHEALVAKVPKAGQVVEASRATRLATARLDDLLTRALAVEPRERPSNVRAFGREVLDALAAEELARPDRPIARTRRRSSTWWLRRAAVLGGLLVAAVVVRLVVR